ncbi:unnamed protein product, partial [Owenia fusiformis]
NFVSLKEARIQAIPHNHNIQVVKGNTIGADMAFGNVALLLAVLINISGYTCSSGQTVCESNPCWNGGKCFEERNGNLTCDCPPGYNGLYCESGIGDWGITA